MYFQISPVARKTNSSASRNEKAEKNDDVQHEILSLALFTTNPKMVFTDVVIGTKHTRTLIVKNPTGNNIKLHLKKSLPEELNCLMSWHEAEIDKGHVVPLDLYWQPTAEVSCRHTFTLSDGKRINRDIGVTFKSIQPKVENKKNRKKTSVSLVRKPLTPTKELRNIENETSKKQLASIDKTRTRNGPSSNLESKEKAPKKVEDKCKNIGLILDDKENFFPSPCSTRTLFITNETLKKDQIMRRRYLTPVIKKESENESTSPFGQLNFLPKDMTYVYSKSTPQLSFKEKRADVTPSIETLLVQNMEKTHQNYANPFLEMKFSPFPNLDLSTKSFSPSVSSTVNRISGNHSGAKIELTPKILFSQHKPDIFTPKDPLDAPVHDGSQTFTTDFCETFIKNDAKENDSLLVTGNFFVSPDNSSESHNSPSHIKCVERENCEANVTESQHVPVIQQISTNEVHSKPKAKSFASDCSTYDQHVVRTTIPTSGLSIQNTTHCKQESRFQQQVTSIVTKSNQTIIKNPFLYADVMDPFLSSQIYCNEGWLDEQEKNFKKWLNTLLTAPEELHVKTEIDVAKTWQDCLRKDVSAAKSKEAISLKYHANEKLDVLRRKAQDLFRSEKISCVLQKMCVVVDTGKLSIRTDKDIQKNLQLKADIMGLILGYNPLWLRIGLETVFNETIQLRSNSDCLGLAHFILEKFFKDHHLLKKYKSTYDSKYQAEIKKFMLKKFLILVYFLDKAKEEKLIQHDPCLFCKTAVEKQSKLMLIHFARETLAAVGDITKYLKSLGYLVNHAQSYIHEFDYAVENLGVDLRDGVRLVRVMEIILLRNDLTSKLRVPAISRLQKIHNMKLVFQSLNDHGYNILYDIDPKNIVDGHREKTLSLLWQIIYKFEAPLISMSARKIQAWFRCLRIVIRRRILKKMHEKRNMAATKIQLWLRRQKLSKQIFTYAGIERALVDERRRNKAIIKIQAMMRMTICRNKFIHSISTIKKIQALCRGWLIRSSYIKRVHSAIIIQKYFRRMSHRKKFLAIRKAAIVIQLKFKATQLMEQERCYYKKLKQATLVLQRWFKSILQMRLQRHEYFRMRSAAVTIQKYYRTYRQREQYRKVQWACSVIQQRYRAHMAKNLQRTEYLQYKQITILIQRRWRARNVALDERKKYLLLKNSAIIIQRKFRATSLMRQVKKMYNIKRSAAITIQCWYRSVELMASTRKQFVVLKNSVLLIEEQYFALKAMRQERCAYLALLKSAKVIQRRFRAIKETKMCRSYFLNLKSFTIRLQNRYRAKRSMIECRHRFLKLKKSTIFVQTIFRANRVAKFQRDIFILKKKSAIKIQQWYRAKLSMLECRSHYKALKSSVRKLEDHYEAKILMKTYRHQYQSMRNATIIIQRWFRSLVIVSHCRERYLYTRNACITIQKQFKMMRTQKYYVNLQNAAIFVQRKYRANILMKQCVVNYEAVRGATVFIQRKYKARRYMKRARDAYLTLRNACLVIQRRYRRKLVMKQQKSQYESIRKAAIFLQRRFRSYRAMIIQRSHYERLRTAAILCQRQYRANKLARNLRFQYCQLRSVAIMIQRRYIAKKLTNNCVTQYKRIKWATLVIQQRFRAQVAMRQESNKFLNQKCACCIIQRRFRAYSLAKTQREWYLKYINSVKIIQNYYRSYIAMKTERSSYFATRVAMINIQRYSRGLLVRRKTARLLTKEAIESRLLRVKQKEAAITIQAFWRGYVIRKKYKTETVQATEKKNSSTKVKPTNSKPMGQRCDDAIMFVMDESISAHILLMAFSDLDFATRHCKDISIRLSDILPHHLYVTIISATRSLPEMNVLNYVSLILINFWKCPETREKTWIPEHLDGVLKVLLHWCDKDESLFPILSTLLWFFAHDDDKKKVILTLPNFKQIFKKIEALVIRKQNMVLKSKFTRLNSVFGIIKDSRLPGKIHNWGLPCKDPYVFNHSVVAFNNFKKILDLA